MWYTSVVQKLTHEQVVELLTEYDPPSIGIATLARKFGVHRNAIRHHLRVAGRNEPYRRKPPEPTAPIPTVKAPPKLPIPKLKKPPTVKPTKAPLCEFCLTRPALPREIDGRTVYSPCAECGAALTDHSKPLINMAPVDVKFSPLSPPMESPE